MRLTRLGKVLLIVFLAYIIRFLYIFGIVDGLTLLGGRFAVWGGIFLVLALLAKFWAWLTEDQ